jgi:DUF4097 and DUF4098 domain-containing protein YvlB
MRHVLIALGACVLVLAGVRGPAGAMVFSVSEPGEDYRERDEINESYKLSAGARVMIHDISGPVEIETWDGETAEVHVVRSARSREDLAHKKVVVEHTPSSLAIHTERRNGHGGWDRVNVRQHVTLKLPYNVELTVNDVAGHVRIERIDGSLQITDVAGALEVGPVNGAPRINDIAGSVTIRTGEITGEGIRINDIAGRVELLVPSGAGADVEITDIAGSISVDVPDATVLGKVDPESFRGRIGAGGPPIAIHDIAGSVTVRNP